MRVVLISIASGLVAPGAAADQFSDAHRSLLLRNDLQFAFRDSVDEPLPPANTGLLEFLRFLEPAFTLIFWGGLAAIVLAILFFIGREIWQARYGREKSVAGQSVQQSIYRPEPERARALLDDSDKLAADGRFDEAVRALLHRSIDDIEQRSPRSVRQAQTGREIARLPILSAAAGEAFAPLVRAVERSLFGGARLNENDYIACRKAYADFALPEAWK